MKTKKTKIKFIAGTAVILFLGGLLFVYIAYKSIFIKSAGDHSKAVSLYIPNSADYEQLCDSLFAHNLISDTALFQRTAKAKSFTESFRPGHYRIPPGITMNRLINKIKGGRQDPVKVTFNNIRTVEELAGKIGRQLEADSAKFAKVFRDNELLDSLDIAQQYLLALIIPNTYEFYWDTSPRQFMIRMDKEHRAFWNHSRRKKAGSIGLTPLEVSTLASIVQEETNQISEMARIAGVYINRLEKGMLLQADPTLKRAINDWSIRRVLNRHKSVPSPYNTYLHKGLPPGPISMPEPYVIEQVLNYEEHDYLFFSASAKRPGFHEFSRTHREHINSANKYRRQLNQRRIYQ
ncbi:MAG: endolytic transglycosylase MltG [Bacteroidales bacterium]